MKLALAPVLKRRKRHIPETKRKSVFIRSPRCITAKHEDVNAAAPQMTPRWLGRWLK
jgi:hypothetical protein